MCAYFWHESGDGQILRLGYLSQRLENECQRGHEIVLGRLKRLENFRDQEDIDNC